MFAALASAGMPYLSGGILSEGTPTFHEVPNLPDWQALLLLILLVAVLVLALYWNTKVYQAPEIGTGHGSSHSSEGGSSSAH